MDQKLSQLDSIPAVDRATNLLYIVSGTTSYKVTPNTLLGITGNPVGTTGAQTLTDKTLTGPIMSAPVLSGTITGTYTIGGTPTFPAQVVLLTGAQTLTDKILTSPTINTATIVNPTLLVDAISEFTGANGVTIDGLNIKDGKLNTNNSVVTTNYTNASVTPDKLATGATTAAVATSETTTSTSYTNLATITDAVTVTIGANGLALVSLMAGISNTTANAFSWVSVDVSGATTLAASDTNAIKYQEYAANASNQLAGTFLLAGLTPGSTIFQMKYKVQTGGSGAGTGAFSNRKIAVVPL